MKTIVKLTKSTAVIFGLGFICSSAAFANVDSINLRFGGGCLKSNSTGRCTLKPRFAGDDLASETALLYICQNSKGSCRKYSNRLRSVSDAGEVAFRIANIPGGCFQVRTGPNGDDKPDVRSNIACEK